MGKTISRKNTSDSGFSLERRVFLAKASILAVGIALDLTIPEQAYAYQQTAESNLLQRIAEHNVNLRDMFSIQELNDIADVLDIYSTEIGDLRSLNFSIGKLTRLNPLPSWLSDPNSPTYNPSPLSGYSQRGQTDINTQSNNISLPPKEVLDSLAEWEYANGKISLGEEGKKHGFRWTLIHELAHALSYKLGFGHEFRVLFFEPKNPSDFYTQWKDLGSQITKSALPLERSSEEEFKITKDSWSNKRPEGYPTKYSYFDGAAGGLGEAFADTVAYLLTGSNYAQDDMWLNRRIALVKAKFEEIKNMKPAPVNQESYINLHVIGTKN